MHSTLTATPWHVLRTAEQRVYSENKQNLLLDDVNIVYVSKLECQQMALPKFTARIWEDWHFIMYMQACMYTCVQGIHACLHPLT